MNVFLPYEKFEDSLRALDDKRLIKQIIECKTILEANKKVAAGQKRVGYGNHPVTVYYRSYPEHINVYGYLACCEYEHRFNKEHSLKNYFKWDNEKLKAEAPFIPYYAEGTAGTAGAIRTTKNVHLLFREKLICKWDADRNNNKAPKWTNVEAPNFELK